MALPLIDSFNNWQLELINKFGEIIGWIGGGCVKSIVVKEAEDTMKSGKARLVRIGKTLKEINEEGINEYKMTCHSEATVEVYIEPDLPAPRLMVMGFSAIARALIRLAKAAGYRVTAVAPDAKPCSFEKADELITQMNLQQVKTTPATFIVVATQGEQDEKVLEEVLSKGNACIGFVSGSKKKARMIEYLIQSGIDKKKVEKIKSPADIDINAKTPEQVGISILAEIVHLLNQMPSAAGFIMFEETIEDTGKPKFYINPVCGIPIDTCNHKHIVDYKGELVNFGCDGCKIKFDQDPEK